MIKKAINTVLFVFLLISVNAQITEIGKASFYADKFHGRITASGETFDMNKLTAAHRTLPFGSVVKVTNLDNNKTVEVTINDRGPFVNDRVIDLSKAAAKKLDFIKKGVARVKVEVLTLPQSKEEKKAPKPNKEAKPETLENNIKPEKPVKPSKTEDKPTEGNSSASYYKVSSKAIDQQGFGVQVLSYREAANLLKQVSGLEKKYNQPVVVQVGGQSNNRVYRIIIGNFQNRAQADALKESLKKDFKGCFTVEMQ